MADNRQFADHVEIGGANVYFQETSTTDTTMPSTSFFKTEDVDGKPVIISRDNIMGIVKDCLGSILNGLTDQTTVTKVPTLNGDTLGASAVSTLASVLGVFKQISYSGSANNVGSGIYACAGNIPDVPGGQWGVLVAFMTSNFCLQFYMSTLNDNLFSRSRGDNVWKEWHQIY